MVRTKEIGPNLSGRNDILKPVRVEPDIIATEEIPGGTVKSGRLGATTIIFILKGSGILTRGKSGQISLNEGVAIMLPIALVYSIEAGEDMLVCTFTLDERVRDPGLYSIISLQGKKMKTQLSPSLLQMNQKVWIFMTNTLSFIDDGMCDSNYQVMKIKELFHILNAYYSPEVLSRFFRPMFSRNAVFAAIVYENWESAGTLEELAALSGLSLSGFSKRFKKVFGIAPYRWIMNRKCVSILSELTDGMKSIKQLAEEYGFYSVQHFGYYCKKRFGLPPGRIRQLSKNLE